MLILQGSLQAEGVTWNLGLISNLGRGEQVGLDYDYLENFLNGSLEYGPWYLDMRLEYSDPPEYGYELKGIQRARLQYMSDRWSLDLGDISAVFGRGLALNLYEDQTIDFDNKIRGFRIKAELFEDHELDLILGSNSDYRFYSPSSDLREPDGQADYDLAGIEANINSASGVWSITPYFIGSRVRSDYIWKELNPEFGGVTSDTVVQTMHVIQGGWGQSIYGDIWDLYIEYNRSWKALDYPLSDQRILDTEQGIILQNAATSYREEGQALNLQLNWFPEWFTALFEYKRYLNGPELAADKRDPYLLATKPLPWQLGPTGIRQHDISLLGNVTHPVDYGDELGWNLELRRSLNDFWAITLNASQTSQARDSRDLEQSAGFWPQQDNRRNPWQEYFTEIEYSGEAISQRMFIAYTRSVLSGASAAELAEHFTLVPAYLSWHPSENIVLSTVIELQRSTVSGELYTGETIEGHSYSSGHFIGSVDLRHKYSAALIWDTSDDPNLNDGLHENQNWVSGELSLKPTDRVWIRASYGKEKGGVRCTGGVCRVLNPFEGYRMSVEWRL